LLDSPNMTTNANQTLETMFAAGAHLGYNRSRRHPSVSNYIFGAKNRVEIIDLEKTHNLLEKAKAFVAGIAAKRGQVLFISGKKEVEDIIRAGARSIDMPVVAGRWVGGTFTNFGQIRKRIDRFVDLCSQREKGELAKYTKKERLLIDREIDKLEKLFGGIVNMKELPKAMFVVDPRREHIAVAEAKYAKIPVIALAGSDCNINDIEYPIVGNDASVKSIKFFVDEMVAAYKAGLLKASEKPVQ
jgi:small subunit ribosomal protein S2